MGTTVIFRQIAKVSIFVAIVGSTFGVGNK
ncbi:MAG: hypothetical protein RLZZ368_1030, partial [Actinomycetota bacterium]